MAKGTPEVESAEESDRFKTGDADRHWQQEQQKSGTAAKVFVAALPWFLLVGYWLSFLSSSNSFEQQIAIGGWLLRSPHYLATHTSAWPIYVLVVCIISLLVFLGIIRKRSNTLLVAVFISGVGMLVSAISLVFWAVGF